MLWNQCSFLRMYIKLSIVVSEEKGKIQVAICDHVTAIEN